jgi:hypothetical protein
MIAARFPYILAVTAIASATLLAATAATNADADIGATGKSVTEKVGGSIVAVKTVIKQSVGGRTGETRSTTNGIIVSKDGLTMISLSAIDPSSLLKQMYAGRIPPGTEMSAEVTDIKIVLTDQTELTAEIVLRDPDLDIAVIRPSVPFTATVTPIDIAADAKVDVLDRVIVARRLDQKADNAIGLSVVHIGAVVRKPRLFYVLGENPAMAGLGSPVFTATGQFLGLMVMRTAAADAGADRGVLLVIIPAAYIRDNAEQAKEVPPAKKTDKPAE